MASPLDEMILGEGSTQGLVVVSVFDTFLMIYYAKR